MEERFYSIQDCSFIWIKWFVSINFYQDWPKELIINIHANDLFIVNPWNLQYVKIN